MAQTLSRRRLMQAGLAGATFTILGGRRAAAAPKFTVHRRAVVSQLPHRYHGWPTLTRRASGQLLLVCSGGREQHVCPFGRVELMRSDDDGQSWSWPRTLLDSPIDDRDAGVVETTRGTLLVTTFTSLAYESVLKRGEAAVGTSAAWPEGRMRQWQAAQRRTSAEQRQAELGVWMTRSTDGGVTWSARFDALVNTPHGPIPLADGRLLYAGKDLWRPPHRVGVCHSTDDGQSWQWLADLPVREGDQNANYHELYAVETADDRLVVQIRNHNAANRGETLQCESDDGGRTWTTPHAIGVWGLPSHLLRLADDRLLMTYGHRRAPLGNQARVSDDGGGTWSEPIAVSDDGISGDLGYPSTVQLGDGTLLSAWYERMADSPMAVLRQAHWSLED